VKKNIPMGKWLHSKTCPLSVKAGLCVWIVAKRLINVGFQVSTLITMQPVSCLSHSTIFLSQALTSNLIGGPGADFAFQSRRPGCAVQGPTATMKTYPKKSKERILISKG
jgi:hypothetical protein